MVISSGCDPEIPSSILGCGTLSLIMVNYLKFNPFYHFFADLHFYIFTSLIPKHIHTHSLSTHTTHQPYPQLQQMFLWLKLGKAPWLYELSRTIWGSSPHRNFYQFVFFCLFLVLFFSTFWGHNWPHYVGSCGMCGSLVDSGVMLQSSQFGIQVIDVDITENKRGKVCIIFAFGGFSFFWTRISGSNGWLCWSSCQLNVSWVYDNLRNHIITRSALTPSRTNEVKFHFLVIIRIFGPIFRAPMGGYVNHYVINM